MFDMQKAGRTISALRKARNMTQMELADRLNISFQAVSNWERGQTMPDISKLGEISQILGVSIDELLGNGKSTKVVEKLIKEEPVEEEMSAEDFLDVAPLVKPDQAEKLWENVTDDVSMEDLAMAAPFISGDMLDSMAVQAAKKDKSFDHLVGLLPFISKKAIKQCLDYVIMDGIKAEDLVVAAPFLDRKDVDGLADRVMEECGVEDLVMLAPFLSKDTVDRLADRIMEDYSTEDLVMLAPFISRDTVDRLADHVMEKCGVKDLVMLAPFMKKKKLTKAAAVFAEKYGFSKILPLLPFLDKDRLDDLIRSKFKDE